MRTVNSSVLFKVPGSPIHTHTQLIYILVENKQMKKILYQKLRRVWWPWKCSPQTICCGKHNWLTAPLLPAGSTTLALRPGFLRVALGQWLSMAEVTRAGPFGQTARPFLQEVWPDISPLAKSSLSWSCTSLLPSLSLCTGVSPALWSASSHCLLLALAPSLINILHI